jgi:hypothetical protein
MEKDPPSEGNHIIPKSVLLVTVCTVTVVVFKSIYFKTVGYGD